MCAFCRRLSVLRAWVSSTGRIMEEFCRWLATGFRPPSKPRVEAPPAKVYKPLRRVILTDGVGRALFEEYALHQDSPRREEETGWVLLGVRDADEALVLATLPAGTERDAGVAHV